MKADLLVTGGLVGTMNPNRRFFQKGAVAIHGNRIVAVGEAGDLEASVEAERVLRVPGRMVLPGFINLHSHSALSILRGVAEDRGPGSIYSLMMPVENVMTEEDGYHMTMLGMFELVRLGTTTVVENWNKMDGAARTVEQIGIRAVISEIVSDAALLEVGSGSYRFDPVKGDEGLKRGMAIVDRWHGKAGGRISVQLSPHAPDTCSPELLKTIGEEARRRGLGITLHVAQTVGEVAQVQAAHGCGSVELMERTGLLGPDVIAAHCIHVSEREIGLLAESGTVVSHNPAINAKRGKIAPAIRILEAGGTVGIGTDNMHGNIVEAWKFAISGARISTGDGTKLQSMQAMEMVTIGGARALGMADRLGSLEVGKLADVVIVDMRKPHLYPLIHPIGSFVHNGMGSDVETVIVDGKVVVENGRLQTVAPETILESAQSTADSVWNRMQERFDVPRPWPIGPSGV